MSAARRIPNIHLRSFFNPPSPASSGSSSRLGYALNFLHSRRSERMRRVFVYATYPAQIHRTSASPSYRLKLMQTIQFGANDRQSSCSSSVDVLSTLCTRSACVSIRHPMLLLLIATSMMHQVFHLLFQELFSRGPCARSFGGDLA